MNTKKFYTRKIPLSLPDGSVSDKRREMADASGRNAFPIPIPERILVAAAKSMKKEELSSRSRGSLQVDVQKSQDLLRWAPPVSVSKFPDEAIKRYLESRK